MKTVLLLLLILLSAALAEAQPLCDFHGRDSLAFQMNADTLIIRDITACGYCSSRFVSSIRVSNDSLYWTQTDTVSDVTTCDCLYDLAATIVGLAPGTYAGVITRAFPTTGAHDVKTFSVHVTAPPASPLTVTGVQSVCHTVGVQEPGAATFPRLVLYQNSPNPFNNSTIIRYQIGAAGTEQGNGTVEVTLTVFDVLGREVAVLLHEWKAPGIHQTVFDAGAMASGIYYYRLTAGRLTESRAMVYSR